jgi:hypothetical protein
VQRSDLADVVAAVEPLASGTSADRTTGSVGIG